MAGWATRRFPIDWPLVIIALLLSLYGISIVYSAGQTDIPTAVGRLWKAQVVWFSLSLGCGVRRQPRVACGCSTGSRGRLYWPDRSCSCSSLLVFGKGAGTAASTKSWLAIGGIASGSRRSSRRSPSCSMLAKVLSKLTEPPKSLLELWKPALVVGIPWLLIMLQPDLGTGIVFIGIFFAMLFWAGVSWQLLVLVASPVVSLILAFNTRLWGAWFLLLIALVLWYKPYMYEGIVPRRARTSLIGVVAPILWEKLAPYQQKRLLVFLDPTVDPRASGYHVIQSQVAIGSGGWFGKGFTQGTQKRLAFLPAQHTDFIFAVVGEELGFIGVHARASRCSCCSSCASRRSPSARTIRSAASSRSGCWRAGSCTCS